MSLRAILSSPSAANAMRGRANVKSPADEEDPPSQENDPTTTAADDPLAPAAAAPSAPTLSISRPSAAAWASQLRGGDPITAQQPSAAPLPTGEAEPAAAPVASPASSTPSFPISRPPARTASASPSPAHPNRFNYTVFASDPVTAQAFAPQINSERLAQAQDAYDQQEAAKQEQRDRNAGLNAEAQATGLRTVRDGAGNLQPLLDPDTGKPLYRPSAGKIKYDPKTGAPYQINRDETGKQTQVDPDADAPIGHADDPKDPQLYRQTKHQPWQAIGHADELADDEKQPANVRQVAQQWRQKRGKLIAQEGVKAAENQVAQALAAHVGAQNRVRELSPQIEELTAQYDPTTGEPLNDAARDAAAAAQPPVGGAPLTGWNLPSIGYGTHPSAEAVAASARKAEREKRLAPLQQEQEQLQAQLGTAKEPGPLALAAQAAKADAEISRHMFAAGNYSNLAEQRRAILKAEGKPEEGDPYLSAVLKQQGAYKVKASQAQTQREQALGQAEGSGHDLSPWYAPMRLPDERANANPAAPEAPANPNEGKSSPRAFVSPAAPRSEGTSVSSTSSEGGKVNTENAQNAPVVPEKGQNVSETAPNVPESPAFRPDDQPPAPAGTLRNAGREFRGGVRAGLLGIGEGFQRSMAGQESATPASVAAGIDKQIADQQAALANIAKLPEHIRATDSIAHQADVAQKTLQKLQAQKVNPATALPPGTNPALLTPEGQQKRDVRVDAAEKSADALRDEGAAAGTYFGQDPARKDTKLARAARAAGGAAPLIASSAVPGVGGVITGAGAAALQAKAGAYNEALAEAVTQGKVDAEGKPTAEAKQEAQHFSDGVALRTVPEMAAFLGAGKITAGLVGKLLSPSAPAATRLLVSSAASTASNAAAGTVNQVAEQAIQGKPLDTSYSLERLVQDSLFGVMHGAGDAANAKREHAQVRAQFQSNTEALNAAREQLGPVTAAEASSHLALPHSDALNPADRPAADMAAAEGFNRRNPDAPKIDPVVVAAAREYAPPGSETAHPVLLATIDRRIDQLEAVAADTRDDRTLLQTQGQLLDAYGQKAALVAESDARLHAVQQINALPDWLPPAGADGIPAEAPDPARTRETAAALFKLANGFAPDQLTAAEQARLNTPKGETPLVRKAGGQTILTDAGRQTLAQAAPAAAPFIQGSEAQQLRALQLNKQASQAEGIAPNNTIPVKQEQNEKPPVDDAASVSPGPEPASGQSASPKNEPSSPERRSMRDDSAPAASGVPPSSAREAESSTAGFSDEGQVVPSFPDKAQDVPAPDQGGSAPLPPALSEKAKNIQRNIDKLAAKAASAEGLSESETRSLAAWRKALDQEISGVGQPAGEVGQQKPPASDSPKEPSASASAAGDQRVGQPVADDLAVGDVIQGGETRYTVSNVGDERHVEVTAPNGKTLKLDRQRALGQRIERAQTQAPVPTASEQPGETSASAPQSRTAREMIDELTARQAKQNGFLEPAERKMLANARENLEREQNRQALGPNPNPSTEAGKQAMEQIRRFEAARDAGATFNASQHAAWKNAIRTLEGDFTRQRIALEAQQPTSNAPEPSQPAESPAPAAPAAPDAPSAASFRRNERVAYRGREGVIEQIEGDKATIRLPRTEKQLGKRVRNVALSSLEKLAKAPKANPEGLEAPSIGNVAPAAPYHPHEAARAATAHIDRHWNMLTHLGMERVSYGATRAGSGVEFGEDGALRIDERKLAASMTAVRDLQSKAGIAGTPEDWFAQVLHHEGIHAADIAVAKAKGQTIEERYDALPDEAMPKGWEKAGRRAYGPEWERLESWQQKAEFVRQIVEGRWTGKITEQLYKFIRETVDYLKQVAGLEGVDPRFKAHVQEVEARVDATRQDGNGNAEGSFKRPSRAAVLKQSQLVRSLERAAQANLDKPDAVDRYQTAARELAEMQRQRALPLQPGETPRSFSMPHAPTGTPDILDHIAEQGGMMPHAKAKAAGRVDRLAGDYDGAPTFGGFYHHAVYGGEMMPDQMAQILHDNYGVGDGSAEGMWKAIGQAVALRGKVRGQQQAHEAAEKQAGRFERDALSGDTAKGKTQVNTANLAIGDKITVGDQTLKVVGIDPDTLDVELEDHSKYGVQKVADGQTLYVEKVEPGSDGAALGAARPSRRDTGTGDLFADEQPARGWSAFSPESGSLHVPREDMPQVASEHRGALANFLKARGIDWKNEEVLPGSLKPAQAEFSPAKVERARDYLAGAEGPERAVLVSADDHVIDGHHQWLAHLRDAPEQPMAVIRLDASAHDILSQIHEFPSAGMEGPPRLRSGENGTGELFQGEDQPFNLAGETGIDHGARQQAQEQVERESAEARARQDQAQGALFAAAPAAEAGLPKRANKAGKQNAEKVWMKKGASSPFFKRWFGDWEKDPANASKAVDAQGRPLPLFHGSPALTRGGFDTFRLPADASDLLAGTGIYLTDNIQLGRSYTINRDELRGGGALTLDPAQVPGSTPVLRLFANIRKPFAAGAEGLADAQRIIAAEFAKQPQEAPYMGRNGKMIYPESAQERAQRLVKQEADLYPKDDPLVAYRALHDALANEGVIRNSRHAAGDDLRPILEAHGFDGIKHVGGVLGGQEHNVWIAFRPEQLKSSVTPGLPGTNSGEFDPANPSILAAAAPAGGEKPTLAGRIKERLASSGEQRAKEHDIARGKDAVETLAGRAARQAGNAVRLDFGSPKELAAPNSRANRDLAAMPFVIEARGDKAALAADLAKLQAGKDPKLAKQYAPILQHGLDNFARLDQKKAAYFRQMTEARRAEIKEAVSVAGLNDHAGRILHDLDHAHDLHPLAAFGMSGATDAHARYVMRGETYHKLVDAIADGHAPKTTNLAELTEQRVLAGQRLIEQKRFERTVTAMKAEDGKPILGPTVETTERLNADGSTSTEQKVPQGYEAVQVGPKLLTVHKDFAPVMRALYGDSAIRQNPVGNIALKAAAFAKHNTLVFDTYHLCRIAAKAVFGFQSGNHKKGLAGLNYAIEDLDRAVAAGHLSQKEADYARESHAVADKLLQGGLNVGRVADNLMEAAHAHGLFEKVPVVGKKLVGFNGWMFNQYQRGVVMQAGVIAYARNRARFPEMSDEAVVRQSAKEVNEFFGNLGSQGFFRSKTMQDAARLTLFAPQWAESQFKSEARGLGQMAKVPVDVVRGKGLRVGNVAQAMGGIILASLIGNQALNLFTRGQTTFQNQEDDHKWDAWIPGGPNNRGFWFSPLSIAAEYSHALIKYKEGGENAMDAAAHIGANKLSPGARAVKELVTGKDYAGRPFASMGERLKTAAIDALPSPLPLSGLAEKDPKAPLGYGLNHQPGSLERQAFSMAGMKVDAEPSATSKMYELAKPYRSNSQSAAGSFPPSRYSRLRRALNNGDDAGARDEIRALQEDQGMSLEDIGQRAFHLKKDGTSGPALFSGSKEGDQLLLRGLNPDRRKLYFEAQKEHHAAARQFQRLAAGLRAETANRQRDAASSPKALAIVALRNGNLGLVNTLLEQGRISPEELPALRRQAKQAPGKAPPARAKPSATVPMGKPGASVAPAAGARGAGRPISDLWAKQKQAA